MQVVILFPLDDALILGLLQAQVHEADFQIGIDLAVEGQGDLLAGAFFNGIADLEHGLVIAFQTFAQGDAAAVVILRAHADGDGLDKPLFGEGAGGAAVKDAIGAQRQGARRLLGIVGIHKAGVVAGVENRGEESEKHDADDDDRGHHGGMVLAEANPRILEIADGLILKLFIGDALAAVYKFKFFRGDLRRAIIHFRHLISPPF